MARGLPGAAGGLSEERGSLLSEGGAFAEGFGLANERRAKAQIERAAYDDFRSKEANTARLLCAQVGNMMASAVEQPRHQRDATATHPEQRRGVPSIHRARLGAGGGARSRRVVT
ncbi:MAG: hypothetical protein HHJ10_01240 [Cellulomonas sp.]|uniref:hypothetical protein n=1 Tax=Cellulomonas sp. TaxID=40001 RepID=UPI0017FC0A67|nr:hypothetical protein [Cellulomonas sp.]NMM29694.1 hypothetical protein [Cellulomonas sp.]